MPDALDEQRIEFFAGLFDHYVAIRAFGGEKAHLDQLVRRERAIDFGEHGVRQARRACLHDNVEIMRKAAQMFPLLVVQPGIGHGTVSRPVGKGAQAITKIASAESAAGIHMARRSKSSSRWLGEHFADEYVKRAQAEGWRSRAVFKLEEIDVKDRLIRPGMTVVDLGAAPGGWSQYAARKLRGNGRIIALDILEMEPLEGVEFLQGDFTEDEALERLLAVAGGASDERSIDLVMSDMAPNMSGMDAIDQPKGMYLAELALDLAGKVLKPGGTFVVKVFQGEGFDEYLRELKSRFSKMVVRKPKASRARSREVYLVASGLRET